MKTVDSKGTNNKSPLLFPVSDLTWDHFIYPRAGKNDRTISVYVEALAMGAEFPPIKIQRVFNYTEGNETRSATVIIDGIHRWHAFRERGIKEISAVAWKDSPLDYEKNKVALLLESAKCNTSHGDRLSASDKKRVARDIASTDPDCRWTEAALAEKLGVTHQTVNIWISDIRARQKASQNRAEEIIGNTNYGNIDTLHSQDRDSIIIHLSRFACPTFFCGAGPRRKFLKQWG